MKEQTIWISLPYATFLLVVTDSKVTMAPPVARWTIGKTADDVVRYYARKEGFLIARSAPASVSPA